MPLKYGLTEPFDLPAPDLHTDLVGLRIAHVTDMHVRRMRSRFERLANQLASLRLDLVFYTGDYMTTTGDETPAFETLRRLTGRVKPTLGSYGVFGNHDSEEVVERCQELPVRWLMDEAVEVAGKPLEVWGLSRDMHRTGDAVALALDAGRLASVSSESGGASGVKPLRLMLAHEPDRLLTGADMGADIVFSGHTHGGQVCMPGGVPLFNSSTLPLRLSSGLLRHRDTLCALSRGAGEVKFKVRTFCPAHVPIYTLRRRSLPGVWTQGIENVEPW